MAIVEFNDSNRDEVIDLAFNAGHKILYKYRGEACSTSIIDHFTKDGTNIKPKKERSWGIRSSYVEWNTVSDFINNWATHSTRRWVQDAKDIPENATNINITHGYAEFNVPLEEMVTIRGGKPVYYIKIED